MFQGRRVEPVRVLGEDQPRRAAEAGEEIALDRRAISSCSLRPSAGIGL